MKYLTTVISYLFHPLLALTYILLLIMLVDPFLFGSYSIGGSIEILAMTVFSTFFFPGLATFMLFKLGFLKDMKMPNHRERVIPLLIAMVCYFSVFAFLYKKGDSPEIFQIAAMGACANLILAFFISIFYKISLHSIGMGAILTMTIYLANIYKNTQIILNLGPMGHYTVPILVLLFVVILLSGLVMTSRLYLKAHKPSEVYIGFALGLITQAIAIIVF